MAESGTPLLGTKLVVPPLRLPLVSRPRLIERLHEYLNYSLVLISAPAGFGKTPWQTFLDVRGGYKIPKKGGIKFPTSCGNFAYYGGKSIIGGPKEDEDIGRVSGDSAISQAGD